jgi:hypothetical protein
MRSLFAATALALVLASPAAHARRHHHHHHHHHHATRGAVDAIGARPAACAGIPWCGCWLRLHLGINDVRLNLARAWASVGSVAPGPARNVIAVWRHHVGLITENLGGGMIRLLSGNDGHAVRDRVRSTRGIIAYRYI